MATVTSLALSVQADLTIEHPSGNIMVQTINPNDISVQFSDAATFRALVRPFRSSWRPKLLRASQRLVDAQGLILRVRIGDENIILLQAGRRPKFALRKLLPQFLLLGLGK